MSSEATVRTSLLIRKGNLYYQSAQTGFKADVAGTNGPTPGTVTAATTGTTVGLSQLTGFGGLCFLANLDATNYVTYGVYAGSTFYPLGKLLAGESVVLRLADGVQYGATGTAHTQDLRLVANAAPVVVRVEAFDP